MEAPPDGKLLDSLAGQMNKETWLAAAGVLKADFSLHHQ